MARHLSLNAHTSVHLDKICTKFSTHAYFEVLFHFMLSKCKNSKNKFYDVIISNELYCNFRCRKILFDSHVF